MARTHKKTTEETPFGTRTPLLGFLALPSFHNHGRVASPKVKQSSKAFLSVSMIVGGSANLPTSRAARHFEGLVPEEFRLAHTEGYATLAASWSRKRVAWGETRVLLICAWNPKGKAGFHHNWGFHVSLICLTLPFLVGVEGETTHVGPIAIFEPRP